MPRDEFIKTFGADPVGLARAPGRVNLIGEHTDYNGGYVLPMAIDRDVRMAFRPADDGRVEIVTLDLNDKVSVEISALDRDRVPEWARYPLGVAAILQEEGHALRGLRAVVKSDVPVGGGLSSSAALEVAAAMAFCSASGLTINREKLAVICQRAEREFVGMRCGIMDQFASLMCRKGHALFLDCATLDYDLVPIDETQASVVVCDTRVKHELTESPYMERQRQCAVAFKLLQRQFPEIETYRDVSVTAFIAHAEGIPQPMRKRAHHVVTEDERVLNAVQSLCAGDLITFGTLMDASHESLQKDFEVSCEELDVLVELAREVNGTFGSRMTGGGFGGCTVSLVRSDAVDDFTKTVTAGYRERCGKKPGVFVLCPSDGATVEQAD